MSTATSTKVLRTAEEVKAAIAESLIPASHWEQLGIPADAHFHDLTPEQVETLSEAMIENCHVVLVELNSETIVALLNLREVMPGEASWTKVGGKGMIADNNRTNRALQEARANALGDTMNAGMFATGPALTLGADGQFINGGHRLFAGVKAISKDANYKVVIRVEMGVPPQLRNLWDWKNREKKPADLLFQDPRFMTAETINTVVEGGELVPRAEEVEPSLIPKLREKLSREYVSFAGFTLMRMSGTNIHGHASDEDILRFNNRCQDAEQLVAEVYRRRLGGDGKELGQLKRIPTSQLASVLLLASNADHDDTTALVVDWSLVEKVMQAFAESTEAVGPFRLYISKLVASFSGKKSLARKGQFSALVDAVQQFIDGGEVTENPIPTETELKKKTFPTFGGVDIGYQEKVTE